MLYKLFQSLYRWKFAYFHIGPILKSMGLVINEIILYDNKINTKKYRSHFF